MRFKDMPKLPLVLIAAMFLTGAIVYPSMPAQIPIHWGPTGQIDGWAAKSFWSVFLTPLMAIGLYVLLWLAPYLDPKRANVIRSKQFYSIAIELITGLMAVVFVGTIFAAQNHALPMTSIIEVAVGIMFIVLGNYMGRVKRNWTMGVRYSWTLSDDTVWAKTNVLGGRLFMLAGALAVVGAFLPPVWGIVLLLIPALGLVPITYVYSWVLYRRLHPEEMTPPEDKQDR
ncbi:MAG: SdpI family protein [Coriobacteriia bacterium]|nr:SdpI family protein [Coriobacteriia bacterium]